MKTSSSFLPKNRFVDTHGRPNKVGNSKPRDEETAQAIVKDFRRLEDKFVKLNGRSDDFASDNPAEVVLYNHNPKSKFAQALSTFGDIMGGPGGPEKDRLHGKATLDQNSVTTLEASEGSIEPDSCFNNHYRRTIDENGVKTYQFQSSAGHVQIAQESPNGVLTLLEDTRGGWYAPGRSSGYEHF